MALDLIAIATTAVVTQFLGPGAKHFGKEALERGKQLASNASAHLAAVGRKPQDVDPKVLLPLVEAASLEPDEDLSAMWAKLLANAADPIPQEKVQVGFVEVLRQLEPADTIILNWL